MNLNALAEADLETTLEDVDSGFGVALLLNDGTTDFNLNAQTTDIGFFIDPETGIGVAGRTVEITIRISTLTGLGGGIPAKTWTGSYTDTNGNTWNFGVQQVRPDRKLGIYNILIEGLK